MISKALRHIRKNHALEHATINVLSQGEAAGIPLAGNSTRRGFYLYGDVPTTAVARAAAEALERLRDGQEGLALSPFCGTNLLVAAALTVAVSAVLLRGPGRLQRLPSAILGAAGGLLVAPALGGLVQRHFTTLADMSGVEVVEVLRRGRFGRTIHRVRTRIREPGD